MEFLTIENVTVIGLLLAIAALLWKKLDDSYKRTEKQSQDDRNERKAKEEENKKLLSEQLRIAQEQKELLIQELTQSREEYQEKLRTLDMELTKRDETQREVAETYQKSVEDIATKFERSMNLNTEALERNNIAIEKVSKRIDCLEKKIKGEQHD